VTNPLSMNRKVVEEERSAPKNKFEKSVGNDLNRIGFKTDFFKRAHFNLIAKEKTIIVAHAGESKKNTEKTIQYMVDFSKITKTPVLAITLEEKTFEIPTIYKKELVKISSSKELLEAIR
jgi:predicted transcriptional regulator